MRNIILVGLNHMNRKSRNPQLTLFPCDTTQRVTPQSPPPPPKPPSPSFELGLSSFPPLPGAAGHLKTDDVFESRLASSVVIGTAKERVTLTPPLFLSTSVHRRQASWLKGQYHHLSLWGSTRPGCLLLRMLFFTSCSVGTLKIPTKI